MFVQFINGGSIMFKTSLITIHGMGVTKPAYNAELVSSLRKKLKTLLNDVSVQSVYYQDLLQTNEAAVWTACQDQVHYDDLRKFLLYGFADAAGLESRKEDLQSVYEMSQRKIADAFLAGRDAMGTNGPLVIIAQSLGCQVISNYIYDAQKAIKARAGLPNASYPTAGMWQKKYVEDGSWSDEKLRFAAGSSINTIFTTGCNMPIFVAAHKQMQIVAIEKPNDDFEWHNYFDPDDVLGWPLRPLSDGYRELVQDHSINSGSGAINWILKSWNPLSHTTYWTDGDVVMNLAKRLSFLLEA
jgi:hypothetical protein